MENNKINVGEKIEILLDKGKKNERFFSKIEAMQDDETFTISRPVNKRGFAHISKGQPINIIYFRKESAYAFDAEVNDMIESGKTITFIVSATSKKYKLQRRDYFRLPIMVTAMVSFEFQGENMTEIFDTVDISGGGLKIMSLRKMKMGSKVELFIRIRGIESEKITGTVVRCMHSAKVSELYDIGIQFTDIKFKVRQAIIRYVFRKQRELIRRGLK